MKLIITDKSIIWKSWQLKCLILTGDKRIKEVAEYMSLEVHGTIWIIDELINNELISSEQAIELLKKLSEINSWLPKNEIEKRISKFKKEGD